MEGDVCFEKLSGGTKGKAMACEAVWWWESLILFGMYFGYCFVMYKNQDMQNWIKAKTEGGDEVATDAEKGETEGLAAPEAGLGRTASRTAAAQLNPDTVMDGKLSMHYTSTWRAGIWSVLMNKQSLARPALLPRPPRRRLRHPLAFGKCDFCFGASASTTVPAPAHCQPHTARNEGSPPDPSNG